MAPVIPHIAEELWANLGKKSFVSQEKWPQAGKTNPEAEFAESLIENVNKDVEHIKTLAKIKKPKKVTIIVSPAWKYDFYASLKKELEKNRDFKTLIEKTMVKEHAQEIPKIIQSVLKDPTKMPQQIMPQDKELAILKQLKLPFKTEITKTSEHAKAKQAYPGKPAILLE
jgi:leucyl-tRNA synthetase